MADCQEFQMDVDKIKQKIQELEKELQDLQDGCKPLDPFDPVCIDIRKSIDRLQGRIREEKILLERARRALQSCERGLPQPGRYLTAGRLTYLRVSHKPDAFGNDDNRLAPAEVIVKLDTEPGRAFGFELPDDQNRYRREGMLSLLRDALVHDLDVTLDYDQEANNANSKIARVTVQPKRGGFGLQDELVAFLSTDP